MADISIKPNSTEGTVTVKFDGGGTHTVSKADVHKDLLPAFIANGIAKNLSEYLRATLKDLSIADREEAFAERLKEYAEGVWTSGRTSGEPAAEPLYVALQKFFAERGIEGEAFEAKWTKLNERKPATEAGKVGTLTTEARQHRNKARKNPVVEAYYVEEVEKRRRSPKPTTETSDDDLLNL
jgi:hypothetical protein